MDFYIFSYEFYMYWINECLYILFFLTKKEKNGKMENFSHAYKTGITSSYFLIGEGKGYRKWEVGWDLGPQPVAISAQLPSYKFSPSSDHSLLLSVFNMAVICFRSYNFF